MGIAKITADEDRTRRVRRSEMELRQRILDAAAAEFVELGYDVATTKAIALRAQVSESLIFRYFGTKAELLDVVALTPFNALLQSFYAEHPQSLNRQEHAQNTRLFVAQLTDYLRRNRRLMASLIQRERQGGNPGNGPLQDYFKRATMMVEELQRRLQRSGSVKADLTVRLGFGLVVSSILFSDWLFEETPCPDELCEALVHYLERAFIP